MKYHDLYYKKFHISTGNEFHYLISIIKELKILCYDDELFDIFKHHGNITLVVNTDNLKLAVGRIEFCTLNNCSICTEVNPYCKLFTSIYVKSILRENKLKRILK